MKKKISGVLSVTLMAILLTGITVNAESYTSGNKGFSKSWELSDKSPNKWEIVYGFNTTFINEDYTHTYHFSKHHTATVTNANGSYANDANAGRWAKIEVTHSGNSVKYSISY